MKSNHILVAEDESKYATPLRRYLSRKGYAVIYAKTDRQLRNHLAARPPLRLVLLDLQLSTRSSPEDGIENIRLIRQQYPTVPIIVLTNHASLNNVVLAIKAGATDLIQKSPAYTNEFLELIVTPKLRRSLLHKAAEDFLHIRKKLGGLSEKVLIKRVIVPLFRRMGFNALPVQHHGSGEKGMDILPFYKLDEFDQRVFSAAQVKATDVHANQNRFGNITSLLDQARTALQTPIQDPDKCRRRLDRFLLITSGELTNEARGILADQLEGDRRITFVDGGRLTQLLIQYDMAHVVGEASANHAVKVYSFCCSQCSPAFGWGAIIKKALRGLRSLSPQLATQLYDRLLDRERLLPTVLGDPFALPHAYHNRLAQHLVILIATPKPMDWLLGYERKVQFVAIQASVGDDPDRTSRLLRLALLQVVGLALKRPNRKGVSSFDKLAQMHDGLVAALKRAGFRTSACKPRLLDTER